MNDEIIATKHDEALTLHAQIMSNGAVAASALSAMCRDLKRMRDEKLYTALGFETFDGYCEEKVGIRARQAYTYISTFERLGSQMIAENAGLGITKLNLLCELNPVDRAEALDSGELTEMSVSEIKALIAEKNGQAEQLSLLTDQLDAAIENLESAKQDLAEASAAEAETDRIIAALRAENEELRTRPIEVSAKPSDEDIKKIRASVEAEYKTKLDEAKKKAAADAEKKAQKNIAAARVEGVEEGKKKAAEAAAADKADLDRVKAELDRIEAEKISLEKRLAAASADGQIIAVHFSAMGESYNKIIAVLGRLEGDEKIKFKTALIKALESFLKSATGIEI